MQHRTAPGQLWRRAAAALLAALLAVLLATLPAGAAAADNSLARIAQSGRVVLGVRDTTLPLSYLDIGGSHLGYHVDICQHVVQALQQRLQLPELKAVMLPTTAATRFAVLHNGSVDIECGHNPVNAAAQAQARLSLPTLIVEERVMALATPSGAMPGADWLAGRRIGVVAGTTTVPALRSLARSAGFRAIEFAGREAGEVFAWLEQGQVDAVALAAPYLLAQRAT
ncbi:MAG: transporter substrate-binding domain-containing protein [Rubrivivax sp.]